jgi:hypothetical protein
MKKKIDEKRAITPRWVIKFTSKLQGRWFPFKIVSVSTVLYPRWPPLLKIEISSNGQKLLYFKPESAQILATGRMLPLGTNSPPAEVSCIDPVVVTKRNPWFSSFLVSSYPLSRKS